jgi:hypothetical protein
MHDSVFLLAGQDVPVWQMILPPIGFLLIFGGGFLLIRKFDRDRRAAIAAWATSRGARCHGTGDVAGPQLPWPLFETGRARTADSVVEIAAAGELPRRKLFRYRYTTGGGKNRHTHRFVVALWENPEAADADRRTPPYQLRPRSWTDAVGAVFGGGGLDLSADEPFKEAFRCDSEDASGAVFRQLDRELRTALIGCARELFVGYAPGRLMVAGKHAGDVEAFQSIDAAFRRVFAAFEARRTRGA